MTRPARLARLALQLLPLLFALGGGLPLAGCAEPTVSGGGGCCRVCTTGKACGDSCIASNLTCRKGAGCACNG